MDRETCDWLSRNAAEQGLTIRRWLGFKLLQYKTFEDFERLKGEGEMTYGIGPTLPHHNPDLRPARVQYPYDVM